MAVEMSKAVNVHFDPEAATDDNVVWMKASFDVPHDGEHTIVSRSPVCQI